MRDVMYGEMHRSVRINKIIIFVNGSLEQYRHILIYLENLPVFVMNIWIAEHFFICGSVFYGVRIGQSRFFVVLCSRCSALSVLLTFVVSHFRTFFVAHFLCIAKSLFHSFFVLHRSFVVSHFRCFALPLFRTFAVSHFSTFIVLHSRTFVISYFRCFAVSYFRCYALPLFPTFVVSHFRTFVV